MIKRALLGTALALLLTSPASGQQPADPPAAQSPDCMMHAMQGQGMQGTAMQGQEMRGMMPMPGMQSDAAESPNMTMACQCAECASRAGFAALFGRPIGALGLTAEQTTELDAVVARAREAALAVLTPEQRATLEAQPAGPAGGCMMMSGAAGAEAEQTH